MLFEYDIHSDHCTPEIFLEEFFGNFGRDFWSKYECRQYYNDNPKYIIEYIEHCKKNKLPCFMSVQPRKAYHKIKGIEKIGLDFDYFDKKFQKKINPTEKMINNMVSNNIHPDDGLREEAKLLKLKIKTERKTKKIKNRNELIEQIMTYRKLDMENEVKCFVKYIMNNYRIRLNPMIVQTNKGYHVYIYCDNVYDIGDDTTLIKEVYNCLSDDIINSFEITKGRKLKYLDYGVKQDVFRIMRIPLSTHDVSGKQLRLMKLCEYKGEIRFEPDKLRHLSFYTTTNLKLADIKRAVHKAKNNLNIKNKELNKTIHRNRNIDILHKKEIRICFLEALKRGELNNQLRLALLLEMYYAGKTIDEMINICSTLSDFSYNKTEYYVKYFMKNEGYKKFRPYKCSTLKKYNLCLRNNKCPYYKGGE